MEANNKPYNHVDSEARIREILDSAAAFEEVNSIPARERLTYSNGFYVNCSALFIDIRGSSKIPEKHTRPVAGKIYRAYLSECVAVMNGSAQCREVFINGDCVSGIFDTPLKADIDKTFDTAVLLNSMLLILNWRLEKKGYSPIDCGIGMSYGRALMLKAGYSGSGINDVIWMGDVVNEASNLCHKGNRGMNEPIQVSSVAHQNLKADNQKYLTRTSDADGTRYEGNVVVTAIKDWLEDKKRAAALAAGLRGLLGPGPR